MSAQSAGAVAHAGAPLPDQAAQDVMCEAYRLAFDKYCANPKRPNRGKFNDYFFEQLRGITPDGANIAAQTAREVPMMVATGVATVPGTVAPGVTAALASDVAASSTGVAGQIANAFVTATSNAAAAVTGVAGAVEVTGAFAGGVVGASVRSCLGLAGYVARVGGAPVWSLLRGLGGRVRFLDGLYNGNPLEIKGPHDSPRPQQLEDNKLLDPNRKPFEVDPVTCNVPQSKVDSCP